MIGCMKEIEAIISKYQVIITNFSEYNPIHAIVPMPAMTIECSSETSTGKNNFAKYYIHT